MNYIIFGGSGFIGTHLIHLLKNTCIKSQDKIYVLDIHPVRVKKLMVSTNIGGNRL